MKRKLSILSDSALRGLLPAAFMLAAVISCGSFNTEYSRCEELCEYARRDCIQGCGNYNSFGFSVDFGKSGISTPYACTDRCEEISVRCTSRCEEKSRMDEPPLHE